MTCPQVKHQNYLNFPSPWENIYINKIAEHHLCAKSEHLPSPLNTAAQRNEASALQGLRKSLLNRQALAHGELKPE